MTRGRKGNLMTTIDRMLTLRAGDVMNRHVVKLSMQESMADAAERLLQHEISGAPVVDDQGHCIGILSAGDFVRRADASFDGRASGAYARNATQQDGGTPRPAEALGANLVAAHMSSAVQAVSEETSLAQVARTMCGGHVHRLPVLDHDGRPVGMISSLDLVAAVLHAVDETISEQRKIAPGKSS